MVVASWLFVVAPLDTMAGAVPGGVDGVDDGALADEIIPAVTVFVLLFVVCLGVALYMLR